MIDPKQAKAKGFNIIDSTKQNNPLKSMLEQHFPDTLVEGQVSLKAIATLLGINPSANTQGYELTFTGKGLANALYTTPTEYELKEEKERSKERESTQNSIIIGDNLDVLKILKSAYYEKIKMTYIDPPYNTKNENFIYPDDFRKDYKKILLEVGLLELDEEGNEVESKTLQAFRNITGSRSHSGWLSFMLPRLKLARDLLKEDGVIFISIDDNEQANLKILCDEIFGEENLVACMPRLTKKAGKTTNNISNNHDYLLCYQKNKINFSQILVNEEDYIENDEFYDSRGGYKLNQTLDYDSLGYVKSLDYPIKIDEKIYYAGGVDSNKYTQRFNGIIADNYRWRWGKEKFEFGLKNGFIEIKGNRIYTKTYFKAKISEKKPYKIEYIDRTKNVSSIELINNQYSNDMANKNLQEIFLKKNIFDYSKSIELLRFLISQTLFEEYSNDIVLDFFAGSGTTAQAVMELNSEDGGNRRFILVQLPEEIKEDKNKTAYDFVKNELDRSEPKISDITIERVNRAGEKLRSEGVLGSSVDIGYRVYSLSQKARLSDKESIIPHDANITPQDIARNLALFAGKPLHTPLEEIVSDKLFACEDILCIVGIDKEVESKILEDKDRAIYIDGYGTYTLESFLNLNIPNDERVVVVY